MAEAEGIPPTASTASVGLGINYVGTRVYAYSGEVSVDNTETDLLNFTHNGAGLIVAKVQFHYVENSGDDFQYNIKLNDILVAGYSVIAATYNTNVDNYIPLLIPPGTTVTCTAQNIQGLTGRGQSVMLVGRVYGAA